MTLEKRLAALEAELDEMKAQNAAIKESTSRALDDLMTRVSSLTSTLATFESGMTGKN
ncbi:MULTISPECIES: hypothetical protein [Leclercia]|uniref:hypothetical protein n=1 Tax=Leclercia TaxID=83654 RepID=UPI0028AEF196|nr:MULTISPECIES: hypothetical protein [Leclercia]MEB6380046.1 hypothetical protein [Leclercia adecarboxylata]